MTTSYRVRLNAFQHGAVRVVEVPDAEVAAAGRRVNPHDWLLELIWSCGQNDNQPVAGRCSVSVGDVIELGDGREFEVVSVGFRELCERERSMAAYAAKRKAAKENA